MKTAAGGHPPIGGGPPARIEANLFPCEIGYGVSVSSHTIDIDASLMVMSGSTPSFPWPGSKVDLGAGNPETRPREHPVSRSRQVVLEFTPIEAADCHRGIISYLVRGKRVLLAC